MPNKDSAVDKFLGSLGTEGEKNPFEENPEDPFETQETVEETVEEVKEEKPLPFNKDPKVQKYLEKREKEIEERLSEKFKEEKPATQQVEDDYYVRLIGNDTPEKVAMIREAMARDERMLQQAEERALGRLSQKEQESIKADKEAEDELETAFENIEENFSVDITSNNPIAKKTRQEFVSFVEKIAPKDRNGDIVDYPDMQSAWETFSEIKKSTATPNRAKELASRSMARSAETTTTPQKRVTFNDAEDFIAGLK